MKFIERWLLLCYCMEARSGPQHEGRRVKYRHHKWDTCGKLNGDHIGNQKVRDELEDYSRVNDKIKMYKEWREYLERMIQVCTSMDVRRRSLGRPRKRLEE